MGFLDKISGILSATPLGKLADRAIDAVLPEKLNEAEKNRFKLKLEELDHARTIELLQVTAAQEAEFNDRIKAMEGTAGDLKTIPIIGPIIIFMRGMQRPLWGWAALFIDFKWFSGAWPIVSEQQQTALIVINMLVLSFMFGERAIKNLEPLIMRVFGGKASSDG